MNTRFVGAMSYVPSLDASRPAFGVIDRDEEVHLVFAEGTPTKAQETILDEAETFFDNRIPELDTVASFVSERLETLVRSGQIRLNKFNGQWCWLG